MGTPGGGLFQNRNHSPNQNTLDQLSNNSISPNEAKSNNLMSRLPNHRGQVIIGADGQILNVEGNNKGATPKLINRSRLINNSSSPFARTPGGTELNKSPLT